MYKKASQCNDDPPTKESVLLEKHTRIIIYLEYYDEISL